jgi:hypothetical protein
MKLTEKINWDKKTMETLLDTKSSDDVVKFVVKKLKKD